jgi:hypothetical protein
MKTRIIYLVVLSGLVVCLNWRISSADEMLKSLGRSGPDVQEASALWHSLSQRSDLSVADVLSGMMGQSDLSKNWFLALAQTLADRNPQAALKDCQQVIAQTSLDPTARFWAFLYLTEKQPDQREPLLESMLDDPCPELRYEAIQLQLDRLEESSSEQPQLLVANYERLLMAARLPTQIQELAGRLREAGGSVDLLQHFGFIDRWLTVGPFDNTQGIGFDKVYGPEEDYLAGRSTTVEQELATVSYPGKNGPVGWKEIKTTEQEGVIDLAEAYEKEKGAIVYALANFQVAEATEAEVRAGSQNALKVWVNGEPAISREVYHAGGQIDQYRASIRLKPGTNSVLVKVCQNEQTDSWAQSWYFQLRFSDTTGLAIRWKQ